MFIIPFVCPFDLQPELLIFYAFRRTLVYVKNGKIVLTDCKSIQIYNIFFSFLLDYSCFIMHILGFLITKISAHCFFSMIYTEELYFPYRWILSINMKGSLQKLLFRGETLCSGEPKSDMKSHF